MGFPIVCDYGRSSPEKREDSIADSGTNRANGLLRLRQRRLQPQPLSHLTDQVRHRFLRSGFRDNQCAIDSPRHTCDGPGYKSWLQLRTLPDERVTSTRFDHPLKIVRRLVRACNVACNANHVQHLDQTVVRFGMLSGVAEDREFRAKVCRGYLLQLC